MDGRAPLLLLKTERRTVTTRRAYDAVAKKAPRMLTSDNGAKLRRWLPIPEHPSDAGFRYWHTPPVLASEKAKVCPSQGRRVGSVCRTTASTTPLAAVAAGRGQWGCSQKLRLGSPKMSEDLQVPRLDSCDGGPRACLGGPHGNPPPSFNKIR